MRKTVFLPVVAIALLILPGCTWVSDYFEAYPDDPARNCRIEKITFEEDEANEGTPTAYALFEYNAGGNPTSIRYAVSSNEPLPKDKGFRYDAHNRLRVYVYDAFITFWHLYTYVSSTEIIDSVFVYCSGDYTVNDHPDTYLEVRVGRLTLDSWGRVIKVKEEATEGGYVSERIFRYDWNGNLIRPGVTYTGKPNIRQTHKVWQFIDMDYSVNQPEGEVELFNSYNLPYQFKNERLQPAESDLPLQYRNTVFEYSCR